MRSGLITTRWQYNLNHKESANPGDPLITTIDQKGTTYLSQAFSEFQIRFSEKTTLNTGIHYQVLWLNQTQALEPRLSIEQNLNDRQTLSFGYGLHSQAQPIGVYFSQEESDGKILQPNHDLGFTKANHFVLGYNYLLNPNLRVKTEVYYQALFHIPVSKDSATSFSMVNSTGEFPTEALINRGTGKNYGVELSVEKFLANRYYFLLSSSLFQSKFKGSDGIERNTHWNSNYSVVFTGGKEFVLSKETDHTILGFNVKVIYTGGLWNTPIDLTASSAAGKTVYDDAQAFTVQNASYFRIDGGMSLKLNRPKLTSTFLLDVQNATNRKNVYGQYFEPITGSIVTYYSTPLIPVLSYRIEF